MRSTELWRRSRWTIAGETPSRSSSVAVVCRRSCHRTARGIATGQSRMLQSGQRRLSLSGCFQLEIFALRATHRRHVWRQASTSPAAASACRKGFTRSVSRRCIFPFGPGKTSCEGEASIAAFR
ncbi:MAG TPA: hypothetical protein VGD74_03910 [Vulgatibacter sp.]